MPTQLHQRSDLHLARKLWHSGLITLVAFLNHALPHEVARTLVLIIGGLFVAGDSLRLFWPALNTLVTRLFGLFMRTHELHRWAGTTWFIAALSLLLLAFEQNTVTVALLVIAWVDPVASTAGVKLGRHKLANNKSWEGFLAAVICGIAILTFGMLSGLWRPMWPLVAIPAAATLIALVELHTPDWLDDNLTIPLAAAVCITGLSAS